MEAHIQWALDTSVKEQHRAQHAGLLCQRGHTAARSTRAGPINRPCHGTAAVPQTPLVPHMKQTRQLPTYNVRKPYWNHIGVPAHVMKHPRLPHSARSVYDFPCRLTLLPLLPVCVQYLSRYEDTASRSLYPLSTRRLNGVPAEAEAYSTTHSTDNHSLTYWAASRLPILSLQIVPYHHVLLAGSIGQRPVPVHFSSPGHHLPCSSGTSWLDKKLLRSFRSFSSFPHFLRSC